MGKHLPAIGLLALWSLWFLSGPAREQTTPERAAGFVEASRAVGEWAAHAVHGDKAARARTAVLKAWSVEYDQPPLPKLLMGLSARWLTPFFGTWGALCTPLFLLGLAAAWLTWRLAERAGGRPAGLAALGLLLFAPGFPHSLHTPMPEAVIGFTWTFLAYALVRGYESAGWRWLSLLAAGLAVTSHAQGMALWLGAWLATWALLRDRETPAPGEPGLLRGPRLPWNVLALPVAGVVLLLLLWPPAQLEGKKALEALWLAPLKAAHPPFAFGGRLLDARTGDGPSAWMGLVDFAARLTPALLVGLVAGGVLSLRRGPSFDPGARQALVIPGALLATSLVICCLNGSTAYEGLRLDLALLPLAATLAGPGLVALGRVLGPRPGGPRGWWRRWLRFVPLVAVGSAAVETAVVLPYDRFYRSAVAPAVWDGGPAGSTLEVQGALLDTWLDDLAREVPSGATLAIVPREAEQARVLELLKRLRRLPAGLRPAKATDARCLGVLHLPEAADAAGVAALVGARREVIRYLLHGVPLFRVVCGAPPRKAGAARKEGK